MNDPNGPIYWRGMYHMFFQYNPNAAVWGDMHWAHAVSRDMMHWRHLPVALAPSAGWADADGCFTGSAIDDHGVATLIYTGVKSASAERATLRDGTHNFREVQCLATSNDTHLRTWAKYKHPIIEPPDDPRLTGFRDPFLWRDGINWYLGVGSGVSKEGGRILLYHSQDLRQWEYLHPLASGEWTGRESVNPVHSGEMWECPDFFQLGSKHVLLYSTAGKVIWETGELDAKELIFHSEKTGILDHGAYYAQKTQLDAHGNRTLWGWIIERRPEAELRAAGWAGCMALPRTLSIGMQSELQMEFAPQTQTLGAKTFAIPERHAAPSERARALQEIRIDNVCGEVAWRIMGSRFALTVADSGGPWWSLQLAPEGNGAKLEVNETTLNVPAPSHREREFHLFLDASVAELICDRRHVVTSRIYRKPNGPLRIAVADSDLAQVTALDAWQLRPISKDRLTT